tara:strand:+ start:264 stop:818 length:555 start_codon:yes stop_codon:yes gene_type:complete
MVEINFYYTEEATLSNLKRIFSSADIPFVRLSKFFDPVPDNLRSELNPVENIGYYRRQEGPAILDDFWQSSKFSKFLHESTGLKLKFRSSKHICYQPGDYSLLHEEENESDRLTVIFDYTKKWDRDWSGYDLFTSPEKDPLICNRDYGSLMAVKLGKEDLCCTRYVSLSARTNVNLDKIVFDLA